MNLTVQDVIVRPIISEKAERGREAEPLQHALRVLPQDEPAALPEPDAAEPPAGRLRGLAGARQVRDAKLALVHGNGGTIAIHCTLILSL